MLNKIKNKIKLLLKIYRFKQINFHDYSEYRDYFIEEDKKSTWDPTIFSNIIEKNLKYYANLHLVEI